MSEQDKPEEDHQAPEGPPPLRQISVTELEESLNLHRTWIESSGAEGTRADFSETSLREAYLQGANLRGAIFRKADLQSAEFQTADLFRADFAEADLMKASFHKAKLRQVNFKKASLIEARFQEADIRAANLRTGITAVVPYAPDIAERKLFIGRFAVDGGDARGRAF